MRRLVDIQRLHAFLRALGQEARGESRVYLTGGASAVLLEWRQSTIDVDLKIEPEGMKYYAPFRSRRTGWS